MCAKILLVMCFQSVVVLLASAIVFVDIHRANNTRRLNKMVLEIISINNIEKKKNISIVELK